MAVAGSGGEPAPTAPAGLASLDFELPADTNLYDLYRFTTPRGDAELTARTVSNRTVERLESLLGLGIACLLVWGVCALIRRGVLAWFARPVGAVILLLAGLLLLCSGVLPVYALLLLLTAGALLVHYFWSRRSVAVE